MNIYDIDIDIDIDTLVEVYIRPKLIKKNINFSIYENKLREKISEISFFMKDLEKEIPYRSFRDPFDESNYNLDIGKKGWQVRFYPKPQGEKIPSPRIIFVGTIYILVKDINLTKDLLQKALEKIPINIDFGIITEFQNSKIKSFSIPVGFIMNL